ncbi:GntR family transcriptional regulator [Olsenella sp. YH-ols2217]|uniref:GntR family transcriptional regulator n=1 Tax=Kribbibacterium absianum TaxID=3044210 RepID=A0ABT6ZHM9_9ACTN|nr:MULTISPECIES: GntR family transcriptional regulator [unclassified Olsenella]MDJ1121062.1 GntR family transcriptional regulator [Olsenella sp. YH-ols2216]MDJ1128553.1 GntR family transcriptional regulator [Olsenella sp. YH-ols2217]
MAEPRTRLEGRGGVSAADCMRVVPRREKESGSAYAYRVLSRNIMMLYMPPGAWIRESSIAEALHVSRTPVHEAMGLLRDRSLVDVAPQSATHVSRISVSELRQSFFMRVAVEPLIVTQLARTVSPHAVADLGAILKQMDEVCSEPGREAEFIDLNARFNKRFYDAAGKGYIWESLQKTGTAYERTYNMGLLYGYSRPNTDMHRQIVSFLRSGGENRHEVTTAIHGMLSDYTQYLERLARDFPDCFVLPRR